MSEVNSFDEEHGVEDRDGARFRPRPIRRGYEANPPTSRHRRLCQQEPDPGYCMACDRIPMDGGHCGCR
jgi:hypothetical protein